MPGFAERTATTVAGRLGDPGRFRNAAAIRSFVGMIPGTNQSGETESRPHLTKAGDPLLRQALYMAAEAARRLDPQLAEIYHSQMVAKGNHHTKAVCAVATALATRLATVLREGRPYELRDTDGEPVDVATARRIIAERYTVPAEIRAGRRSIRTAQRMKGRPVDRDRSRAQRLSPRSDETPTEDATEVAVAG